LNFLENNMKPGSRSAAMKLRGAAALGACLLLGLGCGGGDSGKGGSDTGTTATPGTTPPPAAGGAGGEAGLVALGDSIFHGSAGGGLCYTCHGPDAKGTTLAPNLTDSTWLNTDGTLEGIRTIVTNGVPTPKSSPAPMPPMGGAQLSPDQIRAVAQYVYSLSHPSR
jgi:mono/diheme cytochrome c family protein